MREVLSAIVAISALIAFIFFADPGSRTVIYDCRLSEISPDFPIEVKEECRRMRYEQWKERQRNII